MRCESTFLPAAPFIRWRGGRRQARFRLRTALLGGWLAVSALGVFLGPLAGAARADYPSTVVGDHPVSYWRLNDGFGLFARDTQGYAAGALSPGASFGSDAPVPGGGSATFNGGAITVSTAGHVNLQPPLWSLELWVKASAPPASTASVFRARAYGWGVYMEATGKMASTVNTSNSQGFTVSGGPDLADGRWHYVVATYDGSSTSLYVDGAQIGATSTPAGSTTFYCCDNQDIIGADTDRGNISFPGALSEVALYNYAVSPAQVAAHYAAITSTPCPTGQFLQAGACTYLPSPGPGPPAQPAAPPPCVAPCRSPQSIGSNFDGVFRHDPNNAPITGVYARILNLHPAVAPAGGLTEGWVMLEHCPPSAACDQNRFGQIGWERNSNQQETLIETFNNSDPPPAHSYPRANCDNPNHDLALTCEPEPNASNPGAIKPQPVGQYTFYTVLWNYVPGYMSYYINGHEVARSPDAFTPTAAIVTTEVQNAADQIAGDPSQPEIFDDLHVYTAGGWQAMHGQPITQSTLPYGGLGIDSDGLFFGTWDTAFGDATPAYNQAQQAHDRAAAPQATATPQNRVTVAGTQAHVTVSCPVGPRSCGGSIALNHQPSSRRAAATRANAIATPFRFAMPPGIHTSVTLPLTPLGRRLLAQHGRIVATIVVSPDHGASSVRRVRVARVRPRPHRHVHHRR